MRFSEHCKKVEAVPGRAACRALAARAEAAANGWCARCRKREARDGLRTCVECVAQVIAARFSRNAQLAKDAARKRVARDCAKRAGLCSQCGLREPDAGYACCRACIDSKIAYRHRSAA